MKIENVCALEKIKKLKDNSQDIIYADPPYALGSTVLIGKDGKPYYKEAKDFMSKWEMPDEKFWEEYMFHTHRVLKYGGRMLLFGIEYGRSIEMVTHSSGLTESSTFETVSGRFLMDEPACSVKRYDIIEFLLIK